MEVTISQPPAHSMAKEKCSSPNLMEVSAELNETNNEIIAKQNQLISDLSRVNEHFYSQIVKLKEQREKQAGFYDNKAKEWSKSLQEYEERFAKLKEQEKLKVEVPENKIGILEQTVRDQKAELERLQKAIFQKEKDRDNLNDYYLGRISKLKSQNSETIIAYQNQVDELTKNARDNNEASESKIKSLEELVSEINEKVNVLEQTVKEREKEVDHLNQHYLTKITNLVNKNDGDIADYQKQLDELTQKLNESGDKLCRAEETHKTQLDAAKSAEKTVKESNEKLEQIVSEKETEIESLACRLGESREEKRVCVEIVAKVASRVQVFTEHLRADNFPLNWWENDDSSGVNCSSDHDVESKVNVLFEQIINKVLTLQESCQMPPDSLGTGKGHTSAHAAGEANVKEESRKRKSPGLKYECQLCQISYQSCGALKAHITERHASELSPGTPGKRRKLVAGHSATKTDPTESTAEMVEQQHHEIVDSSDLMCSCGESFETEAFLHLHVSHHSTVTRRFWCTSENCFKSFSSAGRLAQHRRVTGHQISGQGNLDQEGGFSCKARKCRFECDNEQELKSHVENEHFSPRPFPYFEDTSEGDDEHEETESSET